MRLRVQRAAARSEVAVAGYVEGIDYYIDIDTGRLVWTRVALLRRGFCCNRGCRHCPYVAGAESVRLDVVPDNSSSSKKNEPGE